MKMINSIFFLMVVVLILQTFPIFSQAHPKVVKSKVTGVGTVNGKGEIGNAIFTKESTTKDQKSYPALKEFSFSAGSAENFHVRFFYTAKLKDVVAYIKSRQSNATDLEYNTSCQIYDGDNQKYGSGSTYYPYENDFAEWNTSRVEAQEMDFLAKINELSAGSYQIFCDVKMSYKYYDSATLSEKGHFILIASGKIPLKIN